ncbi:MAG TPA: UPF0158 family protein [Desulfuromonadaceae bacterium]|jgi:hypothetical protein
MGLVHDVKIVWDELLDAFSSGQGDRVYFLDRQTGEIFFIPSVPEDGEVWRQIEANQERFLEIPRFDYGVEHQVITGFMGEIEDQELKRLLHGRLTGKKPYGDLNEIVSFYPLENERLLEIKEAFLANRVKYWLEQNDLFTVEPDFLFAPHI